MQRLLKVIVVEDDSALRTAFAENLRNDQLIQTAEAGTLAAGLALVQAERHVVLVVDLGLPDADGVTAVAALRKVAPGATLVVVTGDERLEEPAKAAGAHAVILKTSEDSYGEGLIRAVRTAVINRDLELVNAPAAGRLARVDAKLDTAKRLLPALVVAAGLIVGYMHDRSAAERMRAEGEARALAWWEGRTADSLSPAHESYIR